MDLPIKQSPSAIGHRADWLPDPGVQLYVRDILSKDFGVRLDVLPEHWIPLAIVGTLDWVVICGWWIFRNTGLFESDEPYKWVFDFDGYEFDPDKLLMFKEDPERHKFEERLKEPGITGKERTEALQFLFQDVFEAWYRAEYEYNQVKAEEFFPPQEFIEMTMYATFLWILDEYGRNWIYMQDEVFACVFDFSVAYLSKWDRTLLDPNVMICTKRPLNSCRYCGEVLWCVAGTTIDRKWKNVCNNCLMLRATETHSEVDEYESRIREPHCPHWRGQSGTGGSCTSTCPHSGMSSEKAWEMMEEKGSERLEQYREQVRQMGGRTPRQVAGQTVDTIVEHFKGESAGPTPVSPFQKWRQLEDS